MSRLIAIACCVPLVLLVRSASLPVALLLVAVGVLAAVPVAMEGSPVPRWWRVAVALVVCTACGVSQRVDWDAFSAPFVAQVRGQGALVLVRTSLLLLALLSGWLVARRGQRLGIAAMLFFASLVIQPLLVLFAAWCAWLQWALRTKHTPRNERGPPPRRRVAAPDVASRAPERPLVLLLLCVGGLVAFHLATMAGDAFLYIASGRLVIESGTLPSVDVFSELSLKTPLVLHMLLPMIGFAAGYDSVGGPVLVAVTALAGTAVLFVFAAPARHSWPRLVLACVLLASLIWVDRELFEVRAQVFAYLPFAFLLWLLLRASRTSTAALALMATLNAALWANIHPSVPLAIAFPICFAVASFVDGGASRHAVRPALVIAVASTLGACITPYGPALLIDVLQLLLTDRTTHRIDHMRSPPLDGPFALAWWLFLALTLLILLLRALSPRRERRRDVALAVLFLTMTLVSRRYAAFLCAWSISMCARAALERWPTALRIDALLSPRRAQVAIGVLLVVAMTQVPPPRAIDRNLPFEAVDVLETIATPPRLLNEFGWGGYLMARFGTRRPVFIDGRNNLYNQGVFDDYMHMVFASPRLDELLQKYQVNTVLWTTGWTLDHALQARPQVWRELYRDDKAVIYVRR